MKVLLVEDHPMHMKLARQVLTFDGHRVSEASTHEQAINAIKEERPDIILLDLCLPEMDSLALARQIKADPLTCQIPIVAVTAYPYKFKRTAALDAGCDAFIQKPIDTRKLSGQIDAVVNAAAKPASPPASPAAIPPEPDPPIAA